MNFYEQEKKENELRVKSWNQIEKALQNLNELELKTLNNQSILEAQIKNLKTTNIEENLNNSILKLKNIIGEIDNTHIYIHQELEKIKNTVSSDNYEIETIYRKHKYSFMFFAPAIFLSITFGLVLYYINSQLTQTKNTIIKLEQLEQLQTDSLNEFSSISLGKSKYWFNTKNQKMYLKSTK